MTRCTRCIMPDTRPRMTFNAEGVCNACQHADHKAEVDWAERKGQFQQLLDRNRYISEGFHGVTPTYDCVVPWSGGKDSSTVALRLKEDYGLNPLLANVSPLIPTSVGDHNRESLLRAGFDAVTIRPNQRVARSLSKRFLIERGNPEVARAALISAWPYRVALMYGIPLVVYAEHGESEYGGIVLDEESTRVRKHEEILENQVGDHPLNWVSDEISEADLQPYLYPKEAEHAVEAVYFSYYHYWDAIGANVDYVREHIGFLGDPDSRSVGTFTVFDSLDDGIDPLYFHLMFRKFGFGRATRDANRLLQNDRMTREEALSLAEQFDAEPPRPYQWAALEEYLEMTQQEIEAVLETHTLSP